MAYSSLLFALLATTAQSAVLRDVPVGECYECEVTCFEDCVLKYDREIIQMDLLQVEANKKKNHTEELTEKYGECLKEDKCPCNKEKAAIVSKPKSLKLIVEEKKKGKCAVGMTTCSAKCGQKVIQKDVAAHTAKKSLIQKDIPLHPVAINAFAHGAMNLDQCLKYCLGVTCGCEDANGFDAPGAFAKALKANSASGGAVKDTPAQFKYRPAKIEECGKGMIGKKVASDLYIKLEGGPGGMYEVCSMPFLKKLLGPSGDFDGTTAKCKSGASDMAKYGCLWDAQKDKCVVGFSPILTCQVQYTTDPTF